MEPVFSPSRKHDERSFLQRSIEEGLRDVLGQSGMQMILSMHPLEDLAEDPVRFHQTLKAVFMQNGAAIIEREIARKLLENMDTKERHALRPPRSWIAAARFHARSPRRVTDREREVLRRFLALASLPVDHRRSLRVEYSEVTRLSSSIRLTAASFANAFKKGS